MTVLIDNKVT